MTINWRLTMTFKPFILVAMLVLAGCDAPPALAPLDTMANGHQVALIATVEGCRVYRIMGESHYVYTTICGPETITTSSSYTEACGKSCIRYVPTVNVTSRVKP